MLLPDSTVRGQYRVVYSVDAQPEGQIYRARDERSGRLVLLGALPITDEATRAGFERGAQQIAALHLATLLPVLDHFAEGGSYYIVSEDSGGQDLERALRSRGGPFPEAEVLPHLLALLSDLETLHGQRPPLYLGDLLESDIWVTESGAWRLSPIVLLRHIGETPSPYRAPELFAEAIEPNAASDTYALCALLYRVFTGWTPPTDAQIRAGTPVTAPRTLTPDLSALMEQSLLRGLQVRAENRYQNARELRLAVEMIRMMAGRSLGLGPDAIGTEHPRPQEQEPALATTIEQAPPAAPARPPAYPPPPLYPPPAFAQQPRRGLGTGCLVALALTLTAGVLAVAVALLLFVPALRGLIGLPADSPFATIAPQSAAPTAPAPAAPAPTAPPAAAATAAPTLEPAAQGPNAITLQNAATITRTREITSEVTGPIAFAPDGQLVAIGITNNVSLRQADMQGSGSLLAGHTGQITTLAWSPDSATLASGALEDRVIRLWDAASSTLLRELSGHDGWIRSISFSPDGKVLASGSTDQTIRLWDPATGDEIGTLRGHTGIISGIAFSPDGASLASTARDGTVRLWDVATGQERGDFGFQMPLDSATNSRLWTTGVAFSPDGAQLAVGAIDNAVHVLDARTGAEIRQLTGHTGLIGLRGVVYASDGSRLYTAGLDGSIRIWNPATGQQVGELDGHNLRVSAITVSPDGARLASSSDEEGLVTLWDLSNQQRIGSLRIGQGLITALAYAPNSAMLGSVGFNGTLQLYQFDQRRGQFVVGSAAAPQPLAFVRNDQVVTISDESDVVILAAGAQPRQLGGLNGIPLSVTAARDGSLVAAGSNAGEIGLWTTDDEAPARTLQSRLGAIAQLTISSDGSLLAAAGPASSSFIEVWDLASGTVVQTLNEPVGGVGALAFQPRGTLLAATDVEGTVRIWQASQGTLVHEVRPSPDQQRLTGLAFSPDGTLMAVGALNGDLLLIDPGSGAIVARHFVPQGNPIALAFSPDGQQLAVSIRNEATSVYIFEVQK